MEYNRERESISNVITSISIQAKHASLILQSYHPKHQTTKAAQTHHSSPSPRNHPPSTSSSSYSRCHLHTSSKCYLFGLDSSHDTARVDIVVVEHVADLVIPSVSDGNVTMFVSVITMPPVVVGVSVVVVIFEVVGSRGEVQGQVRVRPELGLFAAPSDGLEDFVTVHDSSDRYLL
eukprot:TRINITY_DN664_c0_g1_i1.p1 TRINITY_DN664_c0_g1~~TRINITY_DN664_c0_g1_i1.p1  ORF type:complete len:176 (-),score=10.87 TRINITY_DN664_c0_g1_i1:296-823(-)